MLHLRFGTIQSFHSHQFFYKFSYFVRWLFLTLLVCPLMPPVVCINECFFLRSNLSFKSTSEHRWELSGNELIIVTGPFRILYFLLPHGTQINSGWLVGSSIIEVENFGLLFDFLDIMYVDRLRLGFGL